MTAQVLVRQLFAPPGADAAHTRHLLAQAAGAHARLLQSSGDTRHESLIRLCEVVNQFMHSPASALEKRLVLDDPQFVEALHALAGESTALAEWDATVAPGCPRPPAERESSLGHGRLGNIVAALALRQRRSWCGQVALATDHYGRMHLPFCDWAIALVDERGTDAELLADQTILLELDEHEARWSLSDARDASLCRMPRATFDGAFIDNRAAIDPRGVDCASGSVRARLERGRRLGDTRIVFQPIGPAAPGLHSETTGAILVSLLRAIAENAPSIFQQLCQCIRTIHGFELPSYGQGQIASFSVPTSPGIIGFNVAYTPRDEPCLSPYCFMWLGHELGHTLHYLIDSVSHTHGWRFLENPGDLTPVIPRYGRSLSVRTLFQVPYVHLFEWWLLMLFVERRFACLPWQTFDDAWDVGEDVHCEIEEAFELIAQHARLTAMGEAAIERLRELSGEALARWRALPKAPGHRRARAG
ncbi:MAG: hypothetical protein AB7O59_08550 [Pirellulales bacterium]